MTGFKIGVIGCGLIGKRRAQVAQAADDDVVLVADIDVERAHTAALAVQAGWTADWQEVVHHPQIEVVVVSTVNSSLLPLTVAALRAGKHVLCEKPLGRNAGEAQEMVEAARSNNRLLKVGFNHRHHPAVWRAHELAQADAIGPLLYIRAAYGHGGRPGYDQEWRGNPELAGGGELLDQGVHVIDLCRWFLGDLVEVVGFTPAYFWGRGTEGGRGKTGDGKGKTEDRRRKTEGGQSDIYPPSSAIEDNGFALLRTTQGQIATIHTSWTQWKNRFSFEVFGRDGYLLVEGLGGSYGTESLTLGRRRPESGPPLEEKWEYPGADASWQQEWQEFKTAIQEGRQPVGNGNDGYQAARVIDAIYASSRTGQVVRLDDGGERTEEGEGMTAEG